MMLPSWIMKHLQENNRAQRPQEPTAFSVVSFCSHAIDLCFEAEKAKVVRAPHFCLNYQVNKCYSRVLFCWVRLCFLLEGNHNSKCRHFLMWEGVKGCWPWLHQSFPHFCSTYWFCRKICKPSIKVAEPCSICFSFLRCHYICLSANIYYNSSVLRGKVKYITKQIHWAI